jgi:cellulose 1,4-beta-cellobiosidase
MRSTLADIRAANRAGGNYAGQFVVYDLPDRDCAAAASNGEYHLDDDGINKYKNYVNTIRDIIKEYSDIRILLVIGASLPTNPSEASLRLTNTLQSPIRLPTWSPT